MQINSLFSMIEKASLILVESESLLGSDFIFFTFKYRFLQYDILLCLRFNFPHVNKEQIQCKNILIFLQYRGQCKQLCFFKFYFIFYTAGSYQLSILYILVYRCQSQSPNSSHCHPPPQIALNDIRFFLKWHNFF